MRKKLHINRFLLALIYFVCIALLAATTARAADVTLTEFSSFNTPIGIDYHETSDSLILSVNYPTGDPNNLDIVARDGTHTVFAPTFTGHTEEHKVATVRTSPGCQQFPVGDVFTANGEPGEIVRIDKIGTIYGPAANNPGIGANQSWIKSFTITHYRKRVV